MVLCYTIGMNKLTNYNQMIQRAIDYIEAHIQEKIDYKVLADSVYMSVYHFQRVFSLFCGVSLGQYIRNRRLSLAADDLLQKHATVLETALKYGYQTPESFSRAFQHFHGCLPSKIMDKGNTLQYFAKKDVDKFIKGDKNMQYKTQTLPQMTLVGYKKHFHGVPYGPEREEQERAFFTSTRAKQWLLLGASCEYSTDYLVITNVDDDGYDFYIAYNLDEVTRDDLFNPNVSGVNFISNLGYEILHIPKQTYVIFQTDKKKRPIADYQALRENIIKEWLQNTHYVFVNAPEMVKMHWRPMGEWGKERYIEICLPITQK